MMTAHARRSDPVSSHLTLASLGRDDSLKQRIVAAAMRLESRTPAPDVTEWWAPWCDNELYREMRRHGYEGQRSVMARSRGLLEQDGWFERVGMFTDPFTNRPAVFFRLTRAAITAP